MTFNWVEIPGVGSIINPEMLSRTVGSRPESVTGLNPKLNCPLTIFIFQVLDRFIARRFRRLIERITSDLL